MSCLTVGLLEARAGTLTTELLGLASSAVGNEECAVVGDKSLLQLVLGVLIDELLVVGDDRLGNSLTDGVNLGSVTTTGDADSDVNTGELVEAEDEDRLVDLESKDLGLDERDGLAVDLDKALALLAVGDSGGGLLLAEALDALGGRHVGGGLCGGCRKVVLDGSCGQ